MLLRQQPRRPPGENIVPLINIVFLLLVFFLLAGTLAPRPPFEIEAIETRESPPAELTASALFVSASGRLFYRGRPTGLAELPGLVEAAHDADEPFEIVLDRRLRAELLFPIVATLAEAGVARIRLLTERSQP